MAPDARRQIDVIIWATLLGLGPLFALSLVPRLLFGMNGEYVDPIYTILFLVLLPLAYAYIVHQRKLLRVDFIINQIAVSFVLALSALTLSVLVLGGVTLAFGLPSELPIVGGIAVALLSLPVVQAHGIVQQQVNRMLYGCHYDFSSVTSTFSSRLAQAVDRDTLTGLLGQSLARQMGIRQATLLLVEGDVLKPQQSALEPCSVPVDDELCQILLQTRTPVRAPHLWDSLSPAALASLCVDSAVCSPHL